MYLLPDFFLVLFFPQDLLLRDLLLQQCHVTKGLV